MYAADVLIILNVCKRHTQKPFGCMILLFQLEKKKKTIFFVKT